MVPSPLFTAKNSTACYSIVCWTIVGTTRYIIAVQCCWTNSAIHYCSKNLVQHRWSNGCSRLWEQKKRILVEQACSLFSLLLHYVAYSHVATVWWLNNAVQHWFHGWTTLLTTLFMRKLFPVISKQTDLKNWNLLKFKMPTYTPTFTPTYTPTFLLTVAICTTVFFCTRIANTLRHS